MFLVASLLLAIDPKLQAALQLAESDLEHHFPQVRTIYFCL